MPIEYQELRLHSEFSLLKAYGRLNDIIDRANEIGQKAVCITDSTTMRYAYQLQEDCANYEKGDIRPIFGCEFNVVPDLSIHGLTEEQKEIVTKDLEKPIDKKRAIKAEETRLNVKKTTKICLRAMDETGLKNLYKLSSIAWTDGFYWVARLDIRTIIEHNEGLSISIGGRDGYVCDELLKGNFSEAINQLELLQNTFKDRIWIEIQPHEDETTKKINNLLYRISKNMEIPLIATNDVHYVREEDQDAHTVVLCIAMKTRISDDSSPRSPKGYFLRTGDEMYEAFQRIHPDWPESIYKDAIENTVKVASRHTAKMHIDRFACYVPSIPSKYDDPDTELRELCIQGWGWRQIPDRAKNLGKDIKLYIKRLDKELRAIKNQKFPLYFLLVRDLINWSRRQGIMTGPGRGSAAGSLVCYLLGITAIDPIEHSLMFERFVSPNRIDMPDIDMDFEDTRREEVIEYLHDKFGRDNVGLIATIGRLKGKAALKDVSRVLGVPYDEVNKITGSIVERSSGDERASQTVEDSFKEFKVCRDFNEKYPEVLPLVVKLEGHAKQIGVHAAGVITSPIELSDLVPVETHLRNNKVVKLSAFDMYGAGAMGLLKLDVLGLRTLTVLSDAVRAVKKRHGIDIDLEAVDLNDKTVLEQFTNHEFVGIFQYDSTGAHAACEDIPFTTFEDIAALTALNRPGTMRSGLATEFKKRKLDPSKIKPFHPLVDEICSDTLGILVYQEQVIRIFTEVAGYTPGTADSLRKKIAKKWGDEAIGRERQKFVRGAMERGVPEKDAGKLMDNITFFGSYGFNKSHASAYGAIAYWGMWLKTYYPTEFCWSLMKNEPSRSEIARYAKEAKRLGIKVLPPDINSSGETFAIDADGNIRSSLVDIKNVGKTAIKAIVEKQPFKSITDMLDRCSGRALNSRVLESLIRAGAMTSLLPNTKWALETIKDKGGWLDTGRKKKTDWQQSITDMVNDSINLPDYTDEDRLFIASEVSPLGGGKHPMKIYDNLVKNVLSDGIDWVSVSSEDFWDHKLAFVKGTLIEIKYNQVGDFHTVEPSDQEKDRIGWGKRYANVNLEDEGGKQHRIKIDIDIFEDYREIVDKGVGVCVAMHVSINKQYHSVRAHYIADLEVMRQKDKMKIPYTLWERCFVEHPAKKYNKNSTRQPSKKGKPFKVTGLITNVKKTKDKNSNEMAFFGVQDGWGNHFDIVAFHSVYEWHSDRIRLGRVVDVTIKKSGRSYFLENSGITKLYK